jgi:predicted Zn-dependent protease
MSESSQASSPSSFFNLHVEGVGYLNRVRTVKPKKGQEFLACTVAALRGSDSDVCYTKFDCRVSGADAQAIVKRLENDVAADKAVIIGFRIADIYPEMFTFEKGDTKGQPGVSIKGRLLRIKFAKVNGEPIDVPQPARAEERESVPF